MRMKLMWIIWYGLHMKVLECLCPPQPSSNYQMSKCLLKGQCPIPRHEFQRFVERVVKVCWWPNYLFKSLYVKFSLYLKQVKVFLEAWHLNLSMISILFKTLSQCSDNGNTHNADFCTMETLQYSIKHEFLSYFLKKQIYEMQKRVWMCGIFCMPPSTPQSGICCKKQNCQAMKWSYLEKLLFVPWRKHD